MTASVLVVVSGLAASGKTTVGRLLSAGLSLPLIDKDDILEALFDTLGCADREQRHRLSRASDEVLLRLAETSGRAVLVNWWDHETAPARLASAADRVVEVFCDCPVEEAAARFAARQRHPGHLDRLRTPEEHAAGIRRLRESYRGPLRIDGAPLVTVDTSGPVDADALLDAVRAHLAARDVMRREP
ncbi:AAA family ATPase [Nocardioides marmotae]|uniref:AAA family ATPase n=1 Tax=Nocardioides marmotae TaxID=2663857 RepID=UPI0012B5A759|nr:AAA family ATPase [Nocardioides marmotae]MBC9731831.1 AAA family ATPase [Nocardioides marmotae]